ncbi:MAG: nucleoside hydrolase [Acidimicrobiia bacterium]|nr:nucleoside hydrolase [Acidimicrobiia bacterium]
MSRSIILDTDPGQDDALALYLALAAPEISVHSVVSVAGNVPQPRVTDNLLALLSLAGRDDIPVYRGCELPLIVAQYTAEYVHGETGIDGADIPPSPRSAGSKHGVDHIIDTCMDAADNSVTLVPVGPLTNIGLAIAKERGIIPKIREIVWMGGAFDEPGNTTSLAEFNAFVDPHAGAIVFNSGIDMTILPLDVTHKALFPSSHITRLREHDSVVAHACAGMIDFYQQHDMDKYGWEGAPMHDPCAVAYLIDPTLFSGRRMSVAMEYMKDDEMGNTYERTDGSDPNATVMFDVDRDRFLELLVTSWCSL